MSCLKEAVDHAILEADKTEYVLYEHLAIDHELVDCTSGPRDPGYLEKVYKIVTFAWKDLLRQMTAKRLEIYNMRERSNWAGPDSVYDAWLLSLGFKRSWFPYGKFNRLYPHWKTTRRTAQSEQSESSDESENEEGN